MHSITRLSLMLAAVALAAVTLSGFGTIPARAQDHQGHVAISPAELSSSRQLQLGLGKSLVIDLPRDAKDVLVSNPAIADAVMRTARRAYLIGVEVGQTNVFFFDGAGRQIAVLEVQVERDLGVLAQSIRQLIPGSSVQIRAVNDNLVLTGSVPAPADAVNAADIAGRFIGDRERVMNMLAVQGSEQVHLKVTVAEVKRNALKQFGVSLEAVVNGGTQLAILSENPFALGQVISGSFARASFGNQPNDRLTAIVQAMESNGLMRVLAEPTLSAISGESAEFLAGGEFPVPVGFDRDTNTATIEYKNFGVSLAFTPLVQNGGRMTLKVKTEVSELTNESAVTVGDLALPGINTRRADTTVELPSGGSLVLAGLLKQDTKQAIIGIPGLKNLPILGALFRSRDFVNNETELVVIATPYLVKPVAPDQLVRPDRNLQTPSDASTIFLGRLNKIYGVAGSNPHGTYHGHVGFIID